MVTEIASMHMLCAIPAYPKTFQIFNNRLFDSSTRKLPGFRTSWKIISPSKFPRLYPALPSFYKPLSAQICFPRYTCCTTVNKEDHQSKPSDVRVFAVLILIFLAAH
ncbi:hypothetical protein LENED_008078 [Lentinula edodes]|uniref:Uncharacterized protein n=1 Tax=Lentinula edodes TaxID=5353 RepID=A0A1Q3EG63_LENED|nr:hypothetical protein LENED_008078 [Lentinula edodes]